jgi:23S rRNA pseudouridine1911/1915/1917 synthase
VGKKGTKIDVAGPRQPPLDGRVKAQFALTWGRARDLIRRGKVTVDGKTITDPLARVRDGAEIVLDLAARNPRTAEAALPRDAIVHLDSHLVVVEKPPGVATMPYDPAGMSASIAKRATRPGEETTLDERVRISVAKREKTKGPPAALGVVHRLDKETSGLLVFTRTWQAKKDLMQAFRFHHVHRRYVALVHGVAQSKTIETHFVEDRGDGLRGSVEHRRGRKHAVGSEKTQRAVTHVEVLETFPRAGASLVACTLETGRTHQIRIHLSEDGHPVLGERVYVRDWEGPEIPAPRVMLHAAELGFVHPATGREMKWESKLPSDFEEVLRSLRV